MKLIQLLLVHGTCWDFILPLGADKLAGPMRPWPCGRPATSWPPTDGRHHQGSWFWAEAGLAGDLADGSLPGSPGSRHAAGFRRCHLVACVPPPDGHSVSSDQDEGTLVPWYLLINGTEPRWRLHDTVDSADLDQSLARVKETGVTTYTLASRNEGETFQSLTINGKNLDRYLITQENDPDPAKTRSRYEAAGF
jgi:hypothetical protein